MQYRVIGVMSGSSLDGIDLAFVELGETAGNWQFDIIAAHCYPYELGWQEKLQHAVELDAGHYLMLHEEYGKYLALKINQFIREYSLAHKVQLIASHGHTTFHSPELGFTAQLGSGAAIAGISGINVVSDLRILDVVLGGQGAPIVPVGEKLFWPDMEYFLNLGGIANISGRTPNSFIAFDVCPANRVLNLLAEKENKSFDEDGLMAATGKVQPDLLNRLNALDYYQLAYPKSLPNSFGTETIYSLIESFGLSTADALRTYTEHIVDQIGLALGRMPRPQGSAPRLLATGGGILNIFFSGRLREMLSLAGIELVIPDKKIIQYKEALIMALLGVLRWREENTVMNSVTGASRSSIGGAVWIGQDA